MSVLSGSGSISNATVVSSQQASGASDTQLLNLQVTTSSAMTVSTITNGFTSAGAPKADFLFVVDNSGSMAQEQTAVSNVAGSFFDRMTQTAADFKIGVITTDSASLRSPGFTNVKTQFTSEIAAGINGNNIESGLHFAGTALSPGNSVNSAGYPRAGGAASSFCSNGFSAFLNIIATQGIGAATPYQLTKTPISSSLSVKVNGTPSTRSSTNGYLYDSVSNSIIFTGSSIPPAGAAISVSYNLFDANQSSLGASLFGAGRTGWVLLIGTGFIAIFALGVIAILRRRKRLAA